MMIQMQGKDDPLASGDEVTCEAFQAQIPEMFSGDTSDIHDHEHLKTCVRCSSLVQELEYIAEMAKRLHEGYDPPDTLWSKIQGGLEEQSEKGTVPNEA